MTKKITLPMRCNFSNSSISKSIIQRPSTIRILLMIRTYRVQLIQNIKMLQNLQSNRFKERWIVKMKIITFIKDKCHNPTKMKPQDPKCWASISKEVTITSDKIQDQIQLLENRPMTLLLSINSLPKSKVNSLQNPKRESLLKTCITTFRASFTTQLCLMT